MLILIQRSDKTPESFERVDCTSHSPSALWQQLSPFHLGPVELYPGVVSKTVENAWQYSKVYPGQVGPDGWPTSEWFKWRDKGLSAIYANRYPMGHSSKPLYSFWIDENGQRQQLSYIEARWKIYLPLYQRCVVQTDAFKILKRRYDAGENIALADFDGYNYKARGMSLREVINNEKKTMGHCVAIAAALGEPLDLVDPSEKHDNLAQLSLF